MKKFTFYLFHFSFRIILFSYLLFQNIKICKHTQMSPWYQICLVFRPLVLFVVVGEQQTCPASTEHGTPESFLFVLCLSRNVFNTQSDSKLVGITSQAYRGSQDK